MKVLTFGARALCVMFLCSPSLAAQRIVTFAFFNAKPWSFMDPHVRDPLCPARGRVVTLTKELVQQLGYTLRCLQLPWPRVHMGGAFAKKVSSLAHTRGVPHALQKGHKDIFIGSVGSFAQYVKQAHMSLSLFRHLRLGIPGEDIPLVFLLSKKSPLMKEGFVSRLNDLLNKLKKEGKVNV